MAGSTPTPRIGPTVERRWHTLPFREVERELGVDPSKGLSKREAAGRLLTFGPNILTEEKRKGIVRLFLEQLRNVLIYILIAAAVISGLLGEISDAVIIAAVILLNAVVGVIQEAKAERSLEALKKLASPKALVRRDGAAIEIPSADVVPGDVIVIDAGRIVPADLRLTETANLKVDESSLTGESVPAEKDAAAVIEDADTPLGDRINMAFSTTVSTYGRGTGIAVETGMRTEIGRIATMLEEGEEGKTPLQQRLDAFGKTLGAVVLALCGLLFLVGIGKPLLFDGSIPREAVVELFFTAVSLAVAVIPEGLAAIVTLVLALGVQRMIKRNAIIRKLPAVETLGSVNIICSDKTGTLTQNRMTVVRFATDGEVSPVEELDPKSDSELLLIEALVLCNDATYGEDGSTGDPTEVALVAAGYQAGIRKDEVLGRHPRIKELPFDSDRKLMTTVHRWDGGDRVMTKGALDNLLGICETFRTGGGTGELTDALRREITGRAEALSAEGLRILGAATKRYREGDVLERGLEFLGFVAMMDPPRLEVKDSITACRESGIRTVMITGDHGATAFAIAQTLGIARDASQVMTGREIDDIDDTELRERIEGLRVFARVSPQHKVRIVTALKSRGNIVSMTGDGVNDAPSLKAADIGVAMGITGTDVAKGASDMVLTDDNFATIVAAVEEGRNIYRNIKKAVVFLLSSNVGEFITVFAAVLAGIPIPLLPIHILWVNLITDTLPALALGVDPGDPGIMRESPRDPRESLFADGAGFGIIANGFLIGALSLCAFAYGLLRGPGPENLPLGRTMAFAVLSASQLFHAFDVRSFRKSLRQIGVFSNRNLVYALLVGLAIQAAVISIPPLAVLFKVVPLRMADWGIVLGLSFVPVIANEGFKVLRKGLAGPDVKSAGS